MKKILLIFIMIFMFFVLGTTPLILHAWDISEPSTGDTMYDYPIYDNTKNNESTMGDSPNLSNTDWLFNDTITFSSSKLTINFSMTGHLIYGTEQIEVTNLLISTTQTYGLFNYNLSSPSSSSNLIYWAFKDQWGTKFGPGTILHITEGTYESNFYSFLTTNATQISNVSGTWTFYQDLALLDTDTYEFTSLTFTALKRTYSSIKVTNGRMYYGDTLVYDSGIWKNESLRLINFEVASTSQALLQFLTAHADKGDHLPIRVTGWFTFFTENFNLTDLMIPNNYRFNLNFTTNSGFYDYFDIIIDSSSKVQIYFATTLVFDGTKWIEPQNQYILITGTYLTPPDYAFIQRFGTFGYVQPPKDESFSDIVYSIADTPFKVLSNLLSVELFGVTFFTAVCGLLLVLVCVYVIKHLL